MLVRLSLFLSLLLVPCFAFAETKASSRVDPFWMEVAQVSSWSVAVVGGLITAWRAIQESRANREQRKKELLEAQETREQRKKELRWSQAKVGTELVEKCQDDAMAWDAMLMIDFGERSFNIDSDKVVTITYDDVDSALRPVRGRFNDKETYIREAFDALFYRYSGFERALAIDLVTLDDVSSPAGYYVGVMANRASVFENYMKQFGFDTALQFVRRFSSWPKPT
jgi:hypothetical protein